VFEEKTLAKKILKELTAREPMDKRRTRTIP
jgi:hypothetical protein